MIKALTLNGKLLATPHAVLSEAKKITTTFVQSSVPRLTAYRKALAPVLAEAKALFAGKQLSPSEQSAALQKVITMAKAVPPPFKYGTAGPKYFGGREVEIVSTGPRYTNDPSFVPAKGPLPVLKATDVVTAAQEMVRQYDEATALIRSISPVGEDPEAVEDYALPEDIEQKLDNVIGQLGDPGDYRSFVWNYCLLWIQLQDQVGRWLYAACSKE